ncbi:uncharacterized protein BDZ99DRAFT_434331 [Mytilinidion resinicola]|uniref:RRM domain-containing protein n=1 Tax=Mytilinidion resinicola TaxID=574789 RepID=A0A6A6Z1E1_9PEZI|nr:uncharacterized protein BDZ99DRAFT_434331 [Mytilinidion resinicola]KAF2814618.1 hypothetical protein BDZ99DRAFT_434331 [Mytilinidion resinicola]
MTPSPPQEAEHFRGKTLTPESPKPVYYPSPSNIPILELQMDPLFHESALSVEGTSPYSSFPHQNPPSDPALRSYYGEAQSAPVYPNAQTGGASASGHDEYGRSVGYAAPGNQDTSAIHTYAQPQHAAASFSDATSTPKHEERSPYPISYDPPARSPYPGADSQPQPSQGYADYSNESYGNGNGTQSNALASTSTLPPAPNLPPRPPPQAKPATHPNYAPEDDIRSYHPHSRKAPDASYRGQPGLKPLMTGNAPGSGPPNSAYSQQPPIPELDLLDDEDAKWPPAINKIYDEFLDQERKFVTDGQWDQFPLGSRLFIGNLPTEKVTKRDIFHRFYRHGRLAQISIKQAYGFVQFLDADQCRAALQAEQGQSIRGRKMHLEISKPQRNTRKADDGGNNARGGGVRRRSRSPDYTRGGTGSQGGRGMDRYSSQPNGSSPRDREFRRSRDDYRPGRSPSPRGGGGGGRGGRGRDRSRDRYDGRRRSPSRSPPGFGRGRYRSPSPRRDTEDDLPLPRRAPHEIPDIQVIVVDDLVRDFIAWVEGAFHREGLRCNVLLLSPRLSEEAVVRRQILEGVQAVSKLDRRSLETSKIPLTIFDRRGGENNIRYEEYADLEPSTAAKLVLNAKHTHVLPIAPPTPTQYGMPSSGYSLSQPGYPQMQGLPSQGPPPPAKNANLSTLISSLDTSGLQKLLGVMQQPNAQQAQQPQTGLSPDLARLLSAAAGPPSQQGYGQQTPLRGGPDQNAYAALANNPALASLLGGQQPNGPQSRAPPAQNQPAPQPDMNEIMAQLAKYRR